MHSKPKLNVFDSKDELVATLADRIADTAQTVQKAKGYFAVALSGGNTPKPLYEMLASPAVNYKIPWPYMYFFMVDERCVPDTDPECNFKMIWECLLSQVPVPNPNVFPLRYQDVNPEKSAQDYEERIRDAFKLAPDAIPAIDLIILGLGDDGHTASLFPGSQALAEKERLVVSNFVESKDQDRITLTFPVINNADRVYFLVTGKSKAQMVANILSSKGNYPAGRVEPGAAPVEWYLDKEAASLLDPAICN